MPALSWAVILLITLSSAAPCLGDEVLPHVSQCNYCQECVITRPPPTSHLFKHTVLGQGRSLLSAKQQRQQVPIPANAPYVMGRTIRTDNRQQQTRSSIYSKGELAAQGRWKAVGETAAIKYSAFALASGVPRATGDPHQVRPELLQPHDAMSKLLKHNCTRCRGCTAQLYDMQSQAAPGVNGVPFTHGRGTTPTWQFFAHVPSSPRRYVVKVFCMPYDKFTGQAAAECDSAKYAERVRLVMAQARLADECGAGDITPRVWLAPIDAVVPAGPFRGFHIRWWVLWMEVARGATLAALPREGAGANATAELLTKRVDGQQVVLASVFDLLTGQCDRHSENVFVTAEGRLTLINNDRALGVVERCRANSMLLPTNTHHTALRLRSWNTSFMRVYRDNAGKEGFCTGLIDPRVALDYRCHVPGGVLGTSYPAPLRTCLEGLAASAPAATAQRYGLPLPPAQLLQRRAADLLAMGFERTAAGAAPEPAPCYVYAPQPPCCDLSYDAASGHVRCGTCWRPVLEERKA